jgi:mono/diheme cytochrome c family protein
VSRFICAGIVVALAGLWGPRVLAQTAPQGTPRLVIKSLHGRDLYQFYCAPCHGCDGRGAGPTAPALKTAPTDLTRLSVANRGVFPRARIEAIVTGRGRPLPAHGSSEMPVWGPIFRGLDLRAGYDEIRIANIVEYLESIQVKYGEVSRPH